MDFNKFIETINSIQPVESKQEFLSELIDKRMKVMEDIYTVKSLEYLDKMKVVVKSNDLKLLLKSLVLLSKTQSKMILTMNTLLDNL